MEIKSQFNYRDDIVEEKDNLTNNKIRNLIFMLYTNLGRDIAVGVNLN